MPLYSYDCLDCKKAFNIRHSYKDTDIECVHCQSKKVKKNLSSVLRATKKCYNEEKKVGTEVQSAIEDGKNELKRYKKNLSKKVYKK